MSTTFGIRVKNIFDEDEVVKVAFRHNGGRMEITNRLFSLLPGYTKVIPLDNTAQGIETVGDIINAVINE